MKGNSHPPRRIVQYEYSGNDVHACGQMGGQRFLNVMGMLMKGRTARWTFHGLAFGVF